MRGDARSSATAPAATLGHDGGGVPARARGMVDAHALTGHLPRPLIDTRHPAALRATGCRDRLGRRAQGAVPARPCCAMTVSIVALASASASSMLPPRIDFSMAVPIARLMSHGYAGSGLA